MILSQARNDRERLVVLLDKFAELLSTRDQRPPHETLGGLVYVTWEARKLLDLPDVAGIEPL